MGLAARTVYVPANTMGSRAETATLLVGTAREYGIDQHDIQSGQGGYWITEELAGIIYGEDEAEVSGNPEPEPEPTKKAKADKTSGNRAAKKTETDKESA